MKLKAIPLILLFIMVLPASVFANLSKTDISQLYVAIFNRASEGEGNRYWQTLELDMATTADVMLATDAAKNYFGESLNTDLAFIEHIYLNTLKKTLAEDYIGITYWVSLLEAGSSRGSVVVSLVMAIKDYAPGGSHYNPSDTATIAAYNQFVNRVTISNYMADTLESPPANWETATKFDSSGLNVTEDHATVINAMAMINGETPELSITPSIRNVGSSSGTTTFSVSNTGTGESSLIWTAEVTSGSNWLAISSGKNGSNAGTITCLYDTNTGTAPRTGMIRIISNGATGSPKNIMVTQQAQTACTYSISPTRGSFSANSESKSVSVTASSSSCSWTASESLSWVSLSPTSGTGSRSVTISVTANTGTARTGSINIAGKTYTISQAENDPKGLNIAYVARNGLTVILTSFDQVDTGGYYNYTVSYTQKNNTTDAIDEGQLKLYLANNTGMPQYGFFNKLYPGDTQSRIYTFKVLYTDATPVILEYDQDNFFASIPVTGSLQWTIPISN